MFLSLDEIPGSSYMMLALLMFFVASICFGPLVDFEELPRKQLIIFVSIFLISISIMFWSFGRAMKADEKYNNQKTEYRQIDFHPDQLGWGDFLLFKKFYRFFITFLSFLENFFGFSLSPV